MCGLGKVFIARNETEDAISCLERAAELQPNFPETHNILGEAYRSGSNFEASAASCRQAIQLLPDYAAAHNNLSLALTKLDKLNEAETSVREAIRIAPTSGSAYLTLAGLYLARGKSTHLDEAEDAARKAVDLDPNLTEARQMLSSTLLRAGKLDDAARVAASAVELDPSSADLKVDLAKIYLQCQRVDDAAAVISSAMDNVPEHPEAHFLLGKIFAEQGKYNQAITAFDTSLQEPSHLMSECLAAKVVALRRGSRDADADELADFDALISTCQIEEPDPFDTVADFNTELAQEVLDHPSLEWQPSGSAVSGGSVTSNLLSPASPAVANLEKFIRRSIDGYLEKLIINPDHPFLRRIPDHFNLRIWATVLGKEGFIGPHFHKSAWLTGVYYARVPEEQNELEDEAAGSILFASPDSESGQKDSGGTKLIQPAPGQLLLFPAYFYHRTLPLTQFGNRISIMFELYPTSWRDNS